MKTTVSILFYIKRAKVNNLGMCPIYTRVTVSAKRFEFSTNKFVSPDKWSTEGNKVKGTNEEARTINSHLDYLKNQIIEAKKSLFKKDIDITVENLKNELFGKNETKRMLIPIFQDHNNKIKELIDKEYTLATLKRYKTSLKHTIDFMQWKYNISDIDIIKIDHVFITDYEFWLRSVRNCANNTAVKYIKNFKKIIRLCIANGWIDRDPFVNYKPKIQEVNREILTQEEVMTIYSKQFKIERLNQVKDIFVFSCFTGLAYIDVKNLTKSHLSIGIDGEKWIFTHRQKTETASRIPVLPIADKIIQKYKNHPQCINKDSARKSTQKQLVLIQY